MRECYHTCNDELRNGWPANTRFVVIIAVTRSQIRNANSHENEIGREQEGQSKADQCHAAILEYDLEQGGNTKDQYLRNHFESPTIFCSPKAKQNTSKEVSRRFQQCPQ